MKLKYICIIILTIFVALCIKYFFVEIYRINSISMYPTFCDGDYILVNKFAFGFKTPEYLPFTNLEIPYWKIGKVNSLELEDVVLLKLPKYICGNNTTYVVKRIMGLPGDTILIKNEDLFVHNKKVSKYCNNYNFVKGNRKNYSIYVYSVGDSIDLTYPLKNELYTLIKNEGHTIDKTLQGYEIDGEFRKFYIIEHDYIFLLGDNAEYSSDSRTWGLIPQRFLIGKVLMKI